MGANTPGVSQALLNEQPETIRAFVAIGIPDPQREALGAYIEACRAAAPTFRWVAPAGLHITLRFLGGVEHERLERLSADLREVADPPFPLRLAGTGTFGRGRIARVYWLGIEIGAEELVRLAGEVEASCLRAGFEPELRPFNPHLTLARSRERRGEVLPQLPPPPVLAAWTVTGFRLYRSRLSSGGANYSVLEDFPG